MAFNFTMSSRTRQDTHAPLAQTTRFASFNPEGSVLSVYMILVYVIPKRKFHSDWTPYWTHSGLTCTGAKFLLGILWTDAKKSTWMAWTCCGMKVIPVSCKQHLMLIYLINKHRRQEALYTRLLLVDNTRRSKCLLRMVKMWIKEIRFYFSVFGYQVKNLKGDMDLKAGLSWSKPL